MAPPNAKIGRLSASVALVCIALSILPACQPAQPAWDFSKVTLVPTIPEPPTPVPYMFGLVLDDASNDQGWNQAHYQAGRYVEAKVAGTKMLYAENPALPPEQSARELTARGARLVIFTSERMAEAGLAFARANPGIYTVIIGGDQAWPEGRNYAALPNLGNINGRMEYGQMVAGCAAALSTQTRQIGYLAPGESNETRRLSASAYLGARHCWQTYRGQASTALQFQVVWMQGDDLLRTAGDFYASGHDVLISGLRTQEAALAANAYADAGRKVWFIPYASIPACEQSPQTCLGVPYYNWGPAYVTTLRAALGDVWQPGFRWNGPDWADINESDTSAIGFVKGGALSSETAAALDQFIDELAFGLYLWTGPLNLQDGTAFLLPGERAADFQVWYLPQSLDGMRSRIAP